jgi:hypothetical protein
MPHRQQKRLLELLESQNALLESVLERQRGCEIDHGNEVIAAFFGGFLLCFASMLIGSKL